MSAVTQPATAVPNSIVLERMSAHLDRLATHVIDLEKTVAAHISLDLNPDESAIRAFQTFDLLRQSLEDLSLLSLLIARFPPTSETEYLALTKKLKLETTKTVLTGGGGQSCELDIKASGELDLF